MEEEEEEGEVVVAAPAPFDLNQLYPRSSQSASFATHGNIFSFYEERDKCLADKRLYEDNAFPATDSSLFYSRSPPKRVTWLRPGVLPIPSPFYLFVTGNRSGAAADHRGSLPLRRHPGRAGRLLAAGGRRQPHSQGRALLSRRPSGSVLHRELRRSVGPPLRSVNQPFQVSSTSSSGSTANGWMLLSTTVCRPATASCSTCTRPATTSSGLLCWKKPTRSSTAHTRP